jgi:phospholipid/cholesterol/gamma-HCH transport system substrate-binding protein
MEIKARYAVIGAFMIAVTAAAFAFVYWLENRAGLGERVSYEVEFPGPVSGLLSGSAVLFNGLRAGEVTGLRVSPDLSLIHI